MGPEGGRAGGKPVGKANRRAYKTIVRRILPTEFMKGNGESKVALKGGWERDGPARVTLEGLLLQPKTGPACFYNQKKEGEAPQGAGEEVDGDGGIIVG